MLFSLRASSLLSDRPMKFVVAKCKLHMQRRQWANYVGIGKPLTPMGSPLLLLCIAVFSCWRHVGLHAVVGGCTQWSVHRERHVSLSLGLSLN